MAIRISSPVKIAATTAHRQFGNLIRRAFSGQEHFIVEKDGLPVVVILSVTEYEELLDARERQTRIQRFEQAARTIGEAAERGSLSEDDIIDQIEIVRQRIHDEQYGNQRKR